VSCNCDYASTLTIKLASVAEQADADELLKLLWSGNVAAAKARAAELQAASLCSLQVVCGANLAVDPENHNIDLFIYSWSLATLSQSRSSPFSPLPILLALHVQPTILNSSHSRSRLLLFTLTWSIIRHCLQLPRQLARHVSATAGSSRFSLVTL